MAAEIVLSTQAQSLTSTRSCPAPTLRNELVFLRDTSHLESSWCALAPSRPGYSDGVDTAATAVINLCRFQHQQNDRTLNLAYGDYDQAMTMLGISFDTSDPTLMTVALLVFSGARRQTKLKVFTSHWHAATDSVRSRRATEEPTDLARSVMYASRDSSFRLPVALGVSSAFDDPRGHQLELPPVLATKTLPLESSKIVHLATRAFIRLPQVIASVRAVENSERNVSVKVTAHLAQELMLLEDVEAENQLLHRVHVVPTLDEVDRVIAPFSFEYRLAEEHAAASTYCEGRLLILFVCVKCIALEPSLNINPYSSAQA